MNKTRMLELADAIEAAPRKKFNMRTFVGRFTLDKSGRRRYNYRPLEDEQILPALKEMSCGTSACIAGWAVHLHPRAGLAAAYENYGGYDVGDHAQAILGLTGKEAYSLFHTRMNLTNTKAAALLRRCVELGTVPSD